MVNAKTTAKKEKADFYIVKVKGNPEFVGKGAGGTQFANGEAKITSERMAAWFREHPGYEVTEVVKEKPEKPAE